MDLNDLMRNVRGTNIESEIRNAIEKVKLEYGKLITEQTCRIYSSLLYDELSIKHVPVRLISTGDLGLLYDHMFLLANSSNIKYYLIDLTYSQFKDENFRKLLENGYQEVTNQDINKYLEVVSKDKTTFDLDTLYYGNIEKEKNI